MGQKVWKNSEVRPSIPRVLFLLSCPTARSSSSRDRGESRSSASAEGALIRLDSSVKIVIEISDVSFYFSGIIGDCAGWETNLGNSFGKRV